MTTAEMLTRLRTLLDEASASLWSDTECYSALADGQNGVVGILVAKYQGGEPLHNLLADITVQADVADGASVPSGFMELVGATAGGKDCEIISFQEYYKRADNSYLSASSSSPIIYRKHTTTTEKLYYSPNSAVTASIFYLKTPTAIASGVEPTLTRGHEAIVQYAFAFLLEKDEQSERSALELKKYYQMVSEL